MLLQRSQLLKKAKSCQIFLGILKQTQWIGREIEKDIIINYPVKKLILSSQILTPVGTFKGSFDSTKQVNLLLIFFVNPNL